MTGSLTAANRDLNNEAIIYQVLYGCLAIVHATLMTVTKNKDAHQFTQKRFLCINDSDTNEPLPEGKLSEVNGSEDGMIIN